VFSVATREGTAFHGFRQINRLLLRNRQELHFQFLFTMPTSDPRQKGYKPPTKETITNIEQGIQLKLDEIAQTINAKHICCENESKPPVKTPYGTVRNFALERLVLLAHKTSEYIGGVNYFYADETCTSCGVCSTVCLSSKIQMNEEHKPVWQRRVLCFMCFACINHCPSESVQIKTIWAVRSHTAENGRYSHPYAKAKEIAAQKKYRENE
jgi:ferredoxin